MAVQASFILERCKDILHDTTNVRWASTELLRYLNDAQREVVLYRPDAGAVTAAMALATGSKQTIPADGIALIDVTRNMGVAGETPGRAISIIKDRDSLDRSNPDWHTETGGTTFHYVHDARAPRIFYVYPSRTSGQARHIEVVYSQIPTNIAATTTVIGVSDIYVNAITDYILYRAFSKDADYQQNAQKAQAHLQGFISSMTGKLQVDSVVAPNKNEPRPILEGAK